MIYKILFTQKAQKQLSKLDRSAQIQVAQLIDKLTNNPQSQGKQLSGNLGELWSWRTGNYRVLGEVFENKLFVTVVKIGHRKSVYSGRV